MTRKKARRVAVAEAKKEKEEEHKVEKIPGCNCPNGCLEGIPILAGQRQMPQGAVRIQCSNDKCSAVPYVHQRCFEKWTQAMVNYVTHCRDGRARDWTVEHTERFLWHDKAHALLYKHCKCPTCGGDLRREVHDEAAEAAKTQKKVFVRKETAQAMSQQRKADQPSSSGGPMAHRKLFQSVGGMEASRFTPMYLTENEKTKPQRELQPRKKPEKSAYIPVGVPGWRKAHGYEDENKKKSYANVATSFIVPSAQPSIMPRSVPSASTRPASTIASNRDPIPSDQLNSEQFVRSLEGLIRSVGGRLWIEDESIAALLGKVAVDLMTEICDSGGLESWVVLNSKCLHVHKGCIVLTDLVPVPHQLKCIGSIDRFVDPDHPSGIINCPNFECKVFFDRNANISYAKYKLTEGDIVSFTAEQIGIPVYNCKWVATEVSLLQSANEQELCPSPPGTRDVSLDQDIADAEERRRFVSESYDCSSPQMQMADELVFTYPKKTPTTIQRAFQPPPPERVPSPVLARKPRAPPPIRCSTPANDSPRTSVRDFSWTAPLSAPPAKPKPPTAVVQPDTYAPIASPVGQQDIACASGEATANRQSAIQIQSKPKPKPPPTVPQGGGLLAHVANLEPATVSRQGAQDSATVTQTGAGGLLAHVGNLDSFVHSQYTKPSSDWQDMMKKLNI